MKLGLKLLQERARKGSFWWPYISNLPETYTVPIFFPGEDIKNLQYAPLLYQVLRGYAENMFFPIEIILAISQALGFYFHVTSFEAKFSFQIGFRMTRA